jgi:hypothetical protein
MVVGARKGSVTMASYNSPGRPPEPPPLFEKHDRVRHAEFGRGYVVKTMRETCRVFFLQDGKTRDLHQKTLEPTS